MTDKSLAQVLVIQGDEIKSRKPVWVDKSFDNWTMKSDERISLSNITSRGHDLDDLLANLTLSFEDWNGNEAWEGFGFDNLSESDQAKVVSILQEKLREARS